jgi:hypothetical protein
MADELEARIERLEKELADVKAVHEADEELKRDAQAGQIYGLSRLRSAKRKTGYPQRGGDDEDED